MIRMLLSKRDGMLTREVDPAHCGRVIADPENLVWVDLDCPTPEEIEVLRREFGFHELAIEDAAKRGQRSSSTPTRTSTSWCCMPSRSTRLSFR